ncbi:rRNA maturation RNase YbeY [candidate division CPR3 bacterium RIFOXYC2_FULL_35_7]|nr:MAG: rRNA maturation RNase YbeY [candidate division CPR3 bacterium RIFOXYC2_FULL_35_7]
MISFNIDEKAPDGFYLLGDVLVSLDQVKKQASQFNATEAEELARVVAHGVLHLLGYEDKTPQEQKKMRNLENKIVSSIQK